MLLHLNTFVGLSMIICRVTNRKSILTGPLGMSIGIVAASNRRTTSRVAETEIATTVTSRTTTGTTGAVTIQIMDLDIITSEEDIATTRIETTTTKRATTAERNDLLEITVTVKEGTQESMFPKSQLVLAITVLEIGVSTSTSGRSSRINRDTTATEEQAQNLSLRKAAESQVGTPTKRRSKNLSLRKYKIKVGQNR